VSGCEQIRPDLGGYVLRALEPAEDAAVREHLRACADCAAEHAELARLPALLTLADRLEDARAKAPPRAVEERLLDTVARERAGPPARRSWPWRRRPTGALVAGAAVAAVAAALVLANGGQDRAGGGDSRGGYDVRLSAAGASPASGRAQLQSVAGGTALHLWVRDLPGDPSAVYEVLCESSDWTASAGSFRVDSRGRAYVVLSTAARRGEYDAIRIVRRDRGSSTEVLTAPLS
jgi:anti-sigma factor RsiW